VHILTTLQILVCIQMDGFNGVWVKELIKYLMLLQNKHNMIKKWVRELINVVKIDSFLIFR
jgi:hypothetical protein